MPKAKIVDDKMLEGGDMLVFVAGTPVIHGKQMPYFMDRELLWRTELAAPVPQKNTEETVQLDQQENTCKGVLDE